MTEFNGISDILMSTIFSSDSSLKKRKSINRIKLNNNNKKEEKNYLKVWVTNEK
jgi:hypothetical protein